MGEKSNSLNASPMLVKEEAQNKIRAIGSEKCCSCVRKRIKTRGLANVLTPQITRSTIAKTIML